MEEFRSYAPEDVIAANLFETAQRLNATLEQETAHLRELAAEIAADHTLTPDFLASLPDHRPPVFETGTTMLPQNADMIVKFEDLYTVWKSVLLCIEIKKCLCAQKQILPDDFFFEAEETDIAARNRMVYQRSSYADNAYLRFAAHLPSPRAVYAHNFPAVCEEVYNGNCEYCILPLENTAEGPLNSFTRLIDRYGLKIAATCDIPTTDGTRITRFALLRRSLAPLPKEDNAQSFFECALPSDETPTAAQLLSAAQLCGLQLCRLDSRIRPTETGLRATSHFVFRFVPEDLTVFLLYLAMEAPHYDAIGLYSHFVN